MTTIAMKLMELFENYSGRLRVHEANAEVSRSGASRSRSPGELAEREALRPAAVVLHPDADELAYYTQQKAQDRRPAGPGGPGEGPGS
jgi:hypothetical protein